MRKIIAYIAMTLDGYIATKESKIGDWLKGDGSDPENFGSYNDFIDTIDTVVLGFKTYDQIVNELSVDVWPYQGKHSYIMTRKDLKDKNEITFTNQSVSQLAHTLKSSEGKNIWLCGGASIIQQFHDLDLIDEYIITIVPYLLGDGIRLFSTSNVEKKLKLISTKSYNGFVDLTYVKR